MHQEAKRDWCQFFNTKLSLYSWSWRQPYNASRNQAWLASVTINKRSSSHCWSQLYNASRKQVCEFKKFLHNIFTWSGCVNAHAIMIAASHACSCEPTAKHQAPQVILLLTLLTLLTHLLFLLRGNTMQSKLSYWHSEPYSFFLPCMHVSTNPWVNPMMMPG